MDLEALRQTILEGCNRILSMPRLVVNRAQRALTIAQKAYWQAASTEELTKLAGLLPAAESLSIEPEALEADPVILAAASSMRDRASKVALQHAIMPCGWWAAAISRDIDALPLVATN